MKTRNYINGRWVDGVDNIPDVNPSDTRDVVGEFSQASTAQVEEAVDAARKAQAIWADSGLEQRYNVLMAIGRTLMDGSTELGELLCREEGKTVPEGKGEVYRAGQFFTYYAAEVLRQMGDICDSVRPGVEIQVTREPVGHRSCSGRKVQHWSSCGSGTTGSKPEISGNWQARRCRVDSWRRPY